jgi:SUN domain-containing protein 1/2
MPPPPEVDGLHRKRRHVSEPPIGASSPGVLFGQLVNTLGRAGATIFSFTLHTVAVLLFWIGRVLGFALDSLFGVPKRFVGQHSGLVQRLLRGLILASAVCGVYYLLRGPVSRIGFGGPSSNHSVYTPPTAPAADVSELSDRLLKLESALSGLSFDNSQERKRADTETQRRVELQAKVDQLERDLRNERKRTSSAEEKAQGVGGELVSVQREIAALRSTIKALPPPVAPGSVSGKDEDARQKLEALERKLGAVEEAKEALELGKDAASKAKEREKEKEAAATKPSWWSKAGSSNRADQLTVRASDGTDVTALIGKIVDSAVGRFHKDDVSRPDFASDSGGAHVIPSLTSDTYALRPVGVKGRMLGLVTGHGYALGRPPVTALHHELHIGNCWPFAGTQGQLGIKLVMPVIIDAVTIDHVAKEVAFDMRTAPREMELWGLVEGRGNVEKVHEFYREKARLRAEQQESDGEVSASSASEVNDEGFDFDAHLDSGSNDRYPSTLPRHAMYFRIASFTYDVHSSKNVQTFAVPEDVRALGVDFGVVALRVRSNWGMEEFTCLYRVRVHGERLVQPELPSPPPPSEEEAEK